MPGKWFTFSITILLSLSIIYGFSYNQKKNNDDDPTSARRKNATHPVSPSKENSYPDNNGHNQFFGSPYYIDNFDGANDTTSLKNRGYKVYYRGGGIQGTAPTWFQGGVFPSFNGPTTGYVAADFQVVNAINNIDSWLVLPKNNIATGDSLVFYSRSDLGSTYPDSIRVMYSALGDSVPEADWTELGRFKAITTGSWLRKAFGAPIAGAGGRFAIRYNVVNGGPSGTNSNYIGIDALTIESSVFVNDISSFTINSPSGNLTLPASTIAPKATFKNSGTSNQSNIPVTYKITGPVNYTSTKTISSLNAGSSIQVIFDSTFVPLSGTYNITVYSSLFVDNNRYNDTLKTTLNAYNPDFGNSSSYYYANSTLGAVPAPSHPDYCWKDTLGSVSLEVNTVNTQSGIFTGDLDDGYWKVLIPGGKKIKFFGNNYDTIRIGTNGIIAFQSFNPGSGNWNPPSTGIPGGNVLNAIYPFWYDFDFSQNTASSTHRISYKVSGSQLIITYDRAPKYSAATGEYFSFQALVDISSAPSANSRVLFQYSDTTSGRTGQAFESLVNNNTLATHLIGLQNSTGTSAFTYRFRNSSSLVIAGKVFNSTLGGLAVESGPDSTQLTTTCQTLVLTVRLEAIQLTRKDTLTVSLRQSTSPYAIIESRKAVYDSTSGTAFVPFALAQNGLSYYVVVTHRNSVQTWSAVPALCTANTLIYDFTTSVSQAFGNNMALVNGSASIFSGDVTGDFCVDLSDLIIIYNNSAAFASGDYLLSDLNYDGFVDLTDMIYAFNNSGLFVCEYPPPGPVQNSIVNSKEEYNYSADVLPESTMSKMEWIRRNH